VEAREKKKVEEVMVDIDESRLYITSEARSGKQILSADHDLHDSI